MTLTGRRAVLEALRAAGSAVVRVHLQEGTHGSILAAIRAAAAERSVPIVVEARAALDALAGDRGHQGVVAEADAGAEVSPDDPFSRAEAAGEPPFLLVLDELKDPGNVGAIVRTAEGAGAHGVLATERRTAPDTEAVARASAGATAHLPVTRVGNLRDALERLKDRGVWIVGADGGADRAHTEADFRRPVAIVLGEEGKGLRDLTRRTCDALVRIPLRGRVESLNVGAAAAVLCFEVRRQRSGTDPLRQAK